MHSVCFSSLFWCWTKNVSQRSRVTVRFTGTDGLLWQSYDYRFIPGLSLLQSWKCWIQFLCCSKNATKALGATFCQRQLLAAVRIQKHAAHFSWVTLLRGTKMHTGCDRVLRDPLRRNLLHLPGRINSCIRWREERKSRFLQLWKVDCLF